MDNNEKTQKNAKKRVNYICEYCDYNTCNLYDFNRHIMTTKHMSRKKQLDDNASCLQKTQYHITMKKCPDLHLFSFQTPILYNQFFIKLYKNML